VIVTASLMDVFLTVLFESGVWRVPPSLLMI
jgi:hypothetical protein